MINYLAIMEHGKKEILLIVLLLCLSVIIYLAYLPIKNGKKSETKPDVDSVKKKLYFIIMELFGDSLNCENKIISYGSSEGDDYIDSFVPYVTVTSVVLSCDTLYLKLDYNFNSKRIIKYDDECFIKVDQKNKLAYLITRDRYVFDDEEAKELVRLYAALAELSSKDELHMIMEGSNV